MFRNEDDTVCMKVEKDRMHAHEDGAIIEDPTLLDWQNIIDNTAKNKAFVVKNDLSKAVDIEQNIYKKELVGDDELQPTVKPETKDTSEVDALKAEIIAKKKALAPLQKAELKKKLDDAGLPTAYKNVTDVEILKKVLDCFNG
jgi:UV DNA damage repair endonuclease